MNKLQASETAAIEAMSNFFRVVKKYHKIKIHHADVYFVTEGNKVQSEVDNSLVTGKSKWVSFTE